MQQQGFESQDNIVSTKTKHDLQLQLNQQKGKKGEDGKVSTRREFTKQLN